MLGRSMQVPPFRHGWDRHSLISSEQFTPWYPATHCGDTDQGWRHAAQWGTELRPSAPFEGCQGHTGYPLNQ